MDTKTEQKQWLKRISVEACLTLGLAVVALGMMFVPLRSSAVSASQAKDEQEDAKRGKDVFEKRCTGCHSLDDDKEGPRLRGVYGSKATTRSNTFAYSEALKASKVTWDGPSLDQWMADPEKIVPNSDMFFRVPNPNERTLVIAYLRTLSE